MKRNTQIMKMADAVKFLDLPSSKGYKTPEYLGMIIDKVEQLDFRFIQFLQLVDILYVIFDRRVQVKQVSQRAERFRPEEEIREHYRNPSRDSEDVQKFMNKKFPTQEKTRQRRDGGQIHVESTKQDKTKDSGYVFGEDKMPWT